MRAEVVSMDAKHPDKEAIKRAGQILQNGGLVAFHTETVYGREEMPWIPGHP